MKNRKVVKPEELKKKFIEHAGRLPYAKLTLDNKYRGWLSGFGIFFGSEEMRLDLKVENHIFLLFVLAVAWSRRGQWENAAYFVAYLKRRREGLATDSPEYWKSKKNRALEKRKSKDSSEWIVGASKPIPLRKKISFPADLYDGVGILANRWDEIRGKLEGVLYPQNPDDTRSACLEFMNFLRAIPGLAGQKKDGKNKRMMMKIPLILRELRCQGWELIPGEYCCVVDRRVKDTVKALGWNMKFSSSGSVKNLIEDSKKVYGMFGDLYDLPLFAYPDIPMTMGR